MGKSINLFTEEKILEGLNQDEKDLLMYLASAIELGDFDPKAIEFPDHVEYTASSMDYFGKAGDGCDGKFEDMMDKLFTKPILAGARMVSKNGVCVVRFSFFNDPMPVLRSMVENAACSSGSAAASGSGIKKKIVRVTMI